MVRAQSVDVVLAHAPDRLSRDVAQISILWDEAKRRGIKIEFTTCQYEQTPEGKLMLQLLSGFSEFERAKIAERTMRGRIEKARQGKIVGGRVPYGYCLASPGVLEPHPEQAAVVRQIFGWALEGISTRQIVDRLREEAAVPHTTSRWAKSSVARILGNETYAGVMYYNRRRRVDRILTTQMRKESEWITVPVPAIIDRATFTAVAARLDSNKRVLAGRPGLPYLLRGLIRCGDCGLAFSGCPSHGRRFYRCTGRERLTARPNRCGARLLQADRTESLVWDAIADSFRDPVRLRSIIERYRDELIGGSDVVAEESRLRKQIETANRRESAIARALADPDLADHYATYKSQLHECRRFRGEVERQLSALQSQSSKPSLDEICCDAAQVIDDLDFEEKRRFLLAVVLEVVIDGAIAKVMCVLPAKAARSNCPQRADDRSARLRQDDACQALCWNPACSHL